MNFVVDGCAGRRLTQWLQSQGHDALDVRDLGPDPGDRALLERAVSENRILITSTEDRTQGCYGCPRSAWPRESPL